MTDEQPYAYMVSTVIGFYVAAIQRLAVRQTRGEHDAT